MSAGDVLIVMDPTSFGAGLAEQKEKLAGLEAMRARLIAEVKGGEPDFSSGLLGDQPALAANERRVFEARRSELASALDALEQAALQRAQEIEETRALDPQPTKSPR